MSNETERPMSKEQLQEFKKLAIDTSDTLNKIFYIIMEALSSEEMKRFMRAFNRKTHTEGFVCDIREGEKCLRKIFYTANEADDFFIDAAFSIDQAIADMED